MKTRFLTLFSAFALMGNFALGQNVGIGTNTPLEKLHVAGSLRVDDLQTAAPAAATTDKVVWVDANGKAYSFPAGAAGKILGVNGAGVLAWLNPGVANTLNNGQIWIGDATNTPVAQTASGDALIDNAGVITIQDNAVDGTDISISAESNGSLMYFDGTDWVNLGVGTAGQILSISGGIPTWVNPAAAPTTGDLTTTTSGVTVTGGTGAVLGAGTTVNVATNALGQNGLVTAPTAGNALQVWGTDALGNPGWVAVSTLLATNDVLAGAGNNAVSITNGTNQVVGATDLTVNVATNALTQDGVVIGTTATNITDVWGTDAAGVPAWRDPNALLNKNDLVAGVGNNAVSITNGTGQIVGGVNATVNVATNALNQAGVVTGTTGANANQVWGTDALGNPAWITPTNDDWHLIGNTTTNDPAAPATYGTSTIAAGENYLGTTDAQDLVLGTNAIERLRVKQTTGYVGLGTAAPITTLHVNRVDDANKAAAYGFASQTTAGADYQNIGVQGSGSGFGGWGYGIGVAGLALGDVSNGAWRAVGVYARYGTTLPAYTWLGTDLPNTALYTDGGGLAPAALFTNGNVGITGTTANPTADSKLDVYGDLALREGTALALAAGNNNNVAIAGEQSHYRITGPAAAFTVTGFTNGNNGQVLNVINATTQTMTLANANAGSTATNQLQTGSSNVNIAAGGAASFIYNSTLTRWVLTGTSGAIDGTDWKTLGNAGTNAATNFVGTTDAVDFVTRTNNTEKMRVTSGGNVGIGTTSPFASLHVNTNGGMIGIAAEGNSTVGTWFSLGNTDPSGRWFQFISTSAANGEGPGKLILTRGAAVGTTSGLFMTFDHASLKVGIGTTAPSAKLDMISINNWDVVNTAGDFRIGNGTNDFRVGVAQGGAGTGDVYMNAAGGTKRIFIGGGTNTTLVTVDGTNNNVGLSIPGGNGTASKLDINGDLALREGTAIAVAAGANALTLAGENSHYRLTGAAGAFNINTIAGGNDGQLLTLINATGQTMTLNNNNAADGILTGNGVNMVSNGTGNSSVTMMYNATLARWVVTSASGMLEGNAWNLTGNAGTSAATNFVGTTDNVDFVTRTNNTEKMRVTNAGRVGIGTASSAIGTTYGFEKLKLAGDANINDVELEAIGAGGFGPFIVFAKSNGTYSTGTRTIVNNGDQIGNFQYNAYDGTAYRPAAHIIVRVDGVPGANDIPTRMDFYTSPDGSAAATQRLSITNAGNIGIGTTAPDASALLQVSAINKGVLIPNIALTATNAAGPITAPATSLLVYNTATAGAGATAVTPGHYYNAGTGAAPDWRRFATGNTGWNVGGNYLTATSIFGSLSNDAIDIYTNNTFRGRMNNTDGEFSWGATNSPYTGDALCGVGTAALPFALNGYSANDGSAVWGEILTGNTTNFSATNGLYYGTGTGAGIYGEYLGTNTSNTRSGVYGVTTTTATGGAGTIGYHGAASGNQHMGVLGYYNGAAFGIGVYGIGFGGGLITGNNDIAVVGWRANNQNYSGYFNGNHVIANGTKSASVPTTQGNQLLYVMESPEVWFEDFGSANLVNGEATIILDDLFMETVLIDEKHKMHVFIQVNGECEDVYVTKGTNSFTVKEKNGGASNVEFSYRIVAKRYHFADHRFGNDPVWGKGDTRQYSQKAPTRPIDYDEAVKMDEEQKRNWKPTPMPEGFKYLGLPNEKREAQAERPASSRRDIAPNPAPVPTSLPKSIQKTGNEPIQAEPLDISRERK